MLSHIYRLAVAYEKLHGFAPNLVYLNKAHLNMLKLQLGNPNNMDHVLEQLGINIILTQSATHPSVGYLSTAESFKSAS